jgi:hypothetical protein
MLHTIGEVSGVEGVAVVQPLKPGYGRRILDHRQLGQPCDDCLGTIQHLIELPGVAGGEALNDQRVDQRLEGLRPAADIADDDRLRMQLELPPRDDLEVTIISESDVCATSRRARKSGMMPITSPPAASAPSATAPIMPMLPPPKMTVMPASAKPRPSAIAVSRQTGSWPDAAPPNTVTALIAGMTLVLCNE